MTNRRGWWILALGAPLFATHCHRSVLEPGGEGGSGASDSSQASSPSASSSWDVTSASSSRDAVSSSAGGPAFETIRLVDAGGLAPAAGVTVLVHDADGHIVDREETDAAGEVKVDVPPGGDVTSLFSDENPGDNGSAREIHTVTDIPDGGLVVLSGHYGHSREQPDSPPMTVEVEALGMPAETDSWSLSFSCADASALPASQSTFAFGFYQGCPGHGTYDVDVFARDAWGGVIAYGRLTDLPFASGTSATHVVSLESSGLRAFASHITGVPAGAQAASHVFADRASGSYFVFTAAANPPTSGRFDSETTLPPAAYFDRWNASAQVLFDPDRGARRVVQSSSAFTPLDFDYASVAQQRVAEETVDDAGVVDIEWAVDSGPVADASVVTESWGSDTDLTYWTAWTPPGAGHVRFPELPPEYEAWRYSLDQRLLGAEVRQNDDAADASYAGWLANAQHGEDVRYSFAKR